jgi:hypothetical protein
MLLGMLRRLEPKGLERVQAAGAPDATWQSTSSARTTTAKRATVMMPLPCLQPDTEGGVAGLVFLKLKPIARGLVTSIHRGKCDGICARQEAGSESATGTGDDCCHRAYPSVWAISFLLLFHPSNSRLVAAFFARVHLLLVCCLSRMKLKQLESALQDMKAASRFFPDLNSYQAFTAPSIKLEQHPTSPHLAGTCWLQSRS